MEDFENILQNFSPGAKLLTDTSALIINLVTFGEYVCFILLGIAKNHY